ncbi:MAG: hypothetical protein GWM87_05820 [Xanthomonadales bacterium]|nr:hypothetical protein [Xanthomonadales bacterium]NIX12497.1 hypothetical protein [Xanthomonadales bacterium]
MQNLPFWLAVTLAAITACKPGNELPEGVQRTGTVRSGTLDEISGIQSGMLNPGAWFVHNDSGAAVVHAIGEDGSDLGAFRVSGAGNRDWEDLAAVPTAGGPVLVIGDIGDNDARRKHVTLYFVREPEPGRDGRFSGTENLLHRLRLTYPDGARDSEALAYDAGSGDLLIISKRDVPPRLYRIPLERALSVDRAELEALGTIRPLRPATRRDLVTFGQREAPWISQPTGMDIDRDGHRAAVITYRSTYLFSRNRGESWQTAFGREPLEIEGPPGPKEEAVGFSPGGDFVLATSEGLGAAVYRLATGTTEN